MAYSSWSVVFGEQPSAAKWNILGTNDAHFYSFLGDNLAWQTWSPSLTNLSGGTQNYAKYIVIGKTCIFKFKYTLAGAGVSGRITFSTPATMATLTAGEAIFGLATLEDNSPADKKIAILEYASSTTIRISASTSDGTYTGVSVATGTSSTVPFTFAANDIILATGCVELA